MPAVDGEDTISLATARHLQMEEIEDGSAAGPGALTDPHGFLIIRQRQLDDAQPLDNICLDHPQGIIASELDVESAAR